MAPNLKPAQHRQIEALLREGKLTGQQIADKIQCSLRSISAARARFRAFGQTRAPAQVPGPKPSMTTFACRSLQHHLIDQPDRRMSEMQSFLEEQHGIAVSERTIRRSLKGWSKKVIRRKAKGQNVKLRNYYIHKLSAYHSHQLVYIDESGCDLRTGQRAKGWSPRGVTPVQVGQFRRGQRYQVLPAYSQDGIIYAQVFEGSTTAAVFEAFLSELLPLISTSSGYRRVLIMDNASVHHSIKVKQMCAAAGVDLLYLPPYSPDYNPIEEFFAELKAFLRTNWKLYSDDPKHDFVAFLLGCIEVVGKRRESARGHFRHAGVTVEET